MSATVCIPWRPQPDRMAAYRRCVRFWTAAGFRVVEGDSDPASAFNVCAARNEAVRRSGSDIVVIADADTVPEDIGQVHRAIEKVADPGSPGVDFCYPHSVYRYIPPEWVDRDDLHLAPILAETLHSPGGMVVCNQEAFWSLGGYDERFTPGRVGYEDTAFMAAVNTLSQWWRIYGTVWSFDHPDTADRTYDDTHPNKARYELYEYANGKPALMAELVKGNSAGFGSGRQGPVRGPC